jgi:serine/threonine protein kinase
LALSDRRWKAIAESQFPWERDALTYVRERLPDHDPYQAWSNFEFVGQDGSINEVDLLVLAPNGLFLIEIKSRPGTVSGDAGTWTWETDGRTTTVDNPVLLANRKAQKLGSLLRSRRAFNQIRSPFVEAAVFLSAPSLKVKLDDRGRQRVWLRDQKAEGDRQARAGIISLLTEPIGGAENRPRLDRAVPRALAQAMEQAGIRPTQRSHRVGDFVLGKLAFEGPGYQDWEAIHVALQNVHRRVRIYPVATGTSTLSRRTLERAAQREYQILEGIRHPGILQAVNFTQDERGPALVFEQDKEAVRMDLFLRERAERLSIDARLGLLRQIAEALKHAHEKRLYHRALGPQSVLISDPDGPVPKARIFNWQTARREPATSAAPGAAATRTTHLGELVEEPARVYLAPEALRDPDADPAPLDVFSLGAIAYHLFSGKPPAANVLEMGERLREDRGLQISAVLDGAGPRLQELIFFATCADVGTRLASVDEFLGHLQAVEDELTAPKREELPDPVEARAGDRIDGGLTVTRRLGKGSSAVALLVEKDGREYVLKVALDPEHHDRVRAEGEVLENLRHQHVCAVHGLLQVAGRIALLMDKAGDETLAQRLRTEGPLHIEMLERFGEDLLQTLDWLEQKGIPHRDIKPDNIGILPVGPDKQRHLVLFDFSLSRTPAENIRAGTVPYLDPFLSLRKPPRWDLHAERFAAAMTLYEMATGVLPVWGDGRSDPAMIHDEVTLDSSRFDPDLREAMTAFFRKALERDYRDRFGNSVEMLKAWRKVFEQAERRPAVEPSGDVLLGEAIATATLETPLAQLGLGTRSLNVLDRANVIDVRGLLLLPNLAINTMRGVGTKTRKEITAVIRRLSDRFPDVGPVVASAPIESRGRKPAEKKRGAKPEAKEPTAEPPPLEVLRRSLDLLAETLVPRTKRKATAQEGVLRALLGLDEGSKAAEPGQWPSQTDVAQRAEVTRARVGQILAKARESWAGDQVLAELGAEIADMLALRGGVMTSTELAAALLTTRGSSSAEPRRSRVASAVARAVVEAEAVQKEPRFGFWRSGDRVLVAMTEALADYAGKLARVADRLAEEDPLPSPARVQEALQRIRQPEGSEPLAPTRLVPLAAAASQKAAVSSRMELYPRGLAAEKALRLAHGAIVGAQTLTPAEIRERVLGRYPDAAALPGRPALDTLLRQAAFDLEWDEVAGAYRSPQRATFTSLAPSLPRFPTTYSKATEVTPEVAEARQFQARLQHAFEHGGFLALTVDPRYLHRAERELADHFALQRKSLEEALIRTMREEAAKAGADWGVVRRADATTRGSEDWTNLMLLVRRSMPVVERELLGASGRVLLVHPGLLARYDQVEMLGRLRDALARPSSLHALWVLLPADGAHEMPVLDGQPIPVLTPGQWARIPDSWLQNLHKSHVPAA